MYPITKLEKRSWMLLSEAKVKIQQAIEEIGIDESQPDNAAEDGAFQHRLELAKQMIDECMRNNEH